MNRFEGKNAINFFRWVILRKDNYDQIVFYFLSRRNTTSSRYYPLFNASKEVRVVVLSGLKLPFTDVFMLKIFWSLVYLFRKKISKYRVIHTFSSEIKFNCLYQVLHLDDPEYSKGEMERLISWEKNVLKERNLAVIVTTNNYTQTWLSNFLSYTKILIIQQGYCKSNIQKVESKSASVFSCVYSSPYIHYGNDKHGNHPSWSADILIDSIIPKLEKFYPGIQIHLIGELGICARRALKKRKNIVLHGRLSQQDNADILATCDLGIYPRNVDYKRSMLKIFSYFGAGLPVVGYDLLDTSVVKDHELGVLVNSDEDFVRAIYDLSTNLTEYSRLKSNVSIFRINHDWDSLARKMERLLY
jgi:glycosyltransferase involved in cell wall biosynthesis